METLYLVLYIVAAVLFALSAFFTTYTRLNLMAAGLLAWVLVPAIQQAQSL
jgi:hypothetical protein